MPRITRVDFTRRGFIGASATAMSGLLLPRQAHAATSDKLRLGMGAAKVATIDPIKLT